MNQLKSNIPAANFYERKENPAGPFRPIEQVREKTGPDLALFTENYWSAS